MILPLNRILTAVILIPVVVALVWWGPPALVAVVAAAVALLALIEFLALGERFGLRAFRKWTLISAAGLFYVQYSLGLVETHTLAGGVSLVRHAVGGIFSIEGLLLIFLFGAAGIGIATRRPLQEVLPALSIGACGLLFVAFPFSYLVRMNEISLLGRQLVLFTLCLVWAGDILAYLVGRSVGRLAMAPALSPKKTWEGALANFVGSLLTAVVFAHWMGIDIVTMLVIGGLANIAGQVGDLLESAYKRGAGVKDSGGLLPGHGGMLDRIDSLILASPVVWALFEWLARSGS